MNCRWGPESVGVVLGVGVGGVVIIVFHWFISGAVVIGGGSSVVVVVVLDEECCWGDWLNMDVVVDVVRGDGAKEGMVLAMGNPAADAGRLWWIIGENAWAKRWWTLLLVLPMVLVWHVDCSSIGMMSQDDDDDDDDDDEVMDNTTMAMIVIIVRWWWCCLYSWFDNDDDCDDGDICDG